LRALRPDEFEALYVGARRSDSIVVDVDAPIRGVRAVGTGSTGGSTGVERRGALVGSADVRSGR
jgi:hypothetical protein